VAINFHLYLLPTIAVPGFLLPSCLIVLVEVTPVEVRSLEEACREAELVLLAVGASAVKESSGFLPSRWV
jgi:hypothetical protein